MLTRCWRSQPIKYRVRDCEPITERLKSISLKSRLSATRIFAGCLSGIVLLISITGKKHEL